MKSNQLSSEDRASLLDSFQQFRESDDESDGNYSNRDELEAKLRSGAGELDETDAEMLLISVNETGSDSKTFQHFNGLLGF